MRALPVSQVKSAKANGSDFGLEGSVTAGWVSVRFGAATEAFCRCEVMGLWLG